MATPTLLKQLLQQRHLQGHRAFEREYDRVARTVDKSLVGGGPSRAQFYRWVSGELTRLPYADHCLILEKMFPGRSAEELFSAPTESAVKGSSPRPAPISLVDSPTMLDLSHVFRSRADFVYGIPPHELFDGAEYIQSSGLSLNLLCQQYPDSKLGSLLERGAAVECLFLDPDCDATRQREEEERQGSGQLAALTRLNMDVLRRLQCGLTTKAAERLSIRTYEGPLRFNITLVDDHKCIAQPYMPYLRGVEAPTFVADKDIHSDGLYEAFAATFAELWNQGKIA